MSFYVNPKYRIKRSADQQEMMQKLISGNKIFNAYRDIMVLSAVVGYVNHAFVPVTKPASDGVLMQFFTETDYDLMDLIAYAHVQEQAILKEDGKYEIFEAFANGGFPILLELLEIDTTTEIDAIKQEGILVRLASLLISNQIQKTDSLFI
mgnify:CR=1 FL=1